MLIKPEADWTSLDIRLKVNRNEVDTYLSYFLSYRRESTFRVKLDDFYRQITELTETIQNSSIIVYIYKYVWRKLAIWAGNGHTLSFVNLWQIHTLHTPNTVYELLQGWLYFVSGSWSSVSDMT